MRATSIFDVVRVLAIGALALTFFFRGHSYESMHLPGGYYILLRWLVCPVLGIVAYKAWKGGNIAWAWIFGVDAAIFNPIFPARLGALWLPLDAVTIVLLGISFALSFGRGVQD